MANYTMELRQVMELTPIFDFDYPIYDESYRPIFEGKFLNYFYFREIGTETIARFKHHLKTELQLKMPIYNKMYKACNLELRILDNYEIKESFEKTNTDNGTTTRNNNTNKTNINEIVNKALFSDTGRKRVDINDVDYVSNINKELNNATSNSDETQLENVTNLNNNTEKWVREMVGNIGVATDMDAITNYLDGLRNVDLLIFEELDNLFMQVW